MPDVLTEAHLGVVLLIEHYPYRFPLLILLAAIIGGCICAPILKDKRNDD